MTTDGEPADRYDGLFEHWERYAGECQGGESATAKGFNRGYDLGFFNQPDDVVTVISNGLRFQRYAAPKEQELACSAYASQESAARYLVDITASRVIAEGRGLTYGDVLATEEPLLPDTAVQGVLASAHPYFPEEFDLFRDGTGEIQLHLVTLIPVTSDEIRLLNALGNEALSTLWRERATDLLDLERDSAV